MLPLLSLPFVTQAAVASWQANNNDVIAWADDGLPIKQEFQEFVRHFGRPELVVVSWPDCELRSDKLASLASLLSEDAMADWFINVKTTKTVLTDLKDIPGRASSAQLRYELCGTFLGQNGKLACLTAELGPTGRSQRPQALRKIHDAAVASGIASADLRVGGIGAELAWMDEESVAGPARLLPIMGILVAVVCVLVVRSIQLGLFISLLGAFTGVLSAALIHWSGARSNAVIATLPTLGGLLSISLSLHFLSYYRNASQLFADRFTAIEQAFRWAIRPTIISATTTAIGLGSLLLSRTNTIQQFGALGAAITVCSAIFSLTLLPAFLCITTANSGHGFKGQYLWSTWSRFVQKQAKLIVVAVVSVATCMSLGLLSLETGIHVDNLFVENHKVLEDGEWLESNLGPLASLEVVVAFPRTEKAAEGGTGAGRDDLMNSLITVQSLAEHLRGSNAFGSVVSAATGLPMMDAKRGVGGVLARTRLRKWLRTHQDELCATRLYAQTDDSVLWRISVRIPTMSNQTASELHAELVSQINCFIENRGEDTSESEADFEFSITGLPLLFEQIEEQFIEDLLSTYLCGLGLITLAVFFVLRDVRESVIAMIPNVLPAIFVLGGLSIAGVELDVGSVMTASIALGVAVDDTLHFVLWYQQKRKSNVSATESIRSAILHCGAPILQTSIICGLGLAVLSFAPMLPTVRFGSLIAMMLGVALVGDLLFLPAILSIGKPNDDV